MALFVEQNGTATATFSRPMDVRAEKGMSVHWIDPNDSRLRIEEAGPGCLDTSGYRKSTSLHSFDQTSASDWSYSTYSSSSLASCGNGRSWRFRGHLRWNASSPFSQTEPVWVTDSVDAWGETSTSPVFLRGNLVGPLELRWSRLADADSATRASWSKSSSMLVGLVDEWKSIQASRGRNASVLALDTAQKTKAWRWHDLDTVLLHRVLASKIRIDRDHELLRTVFSAGDSLWPPVDHYAWIEAQVTGTASADMYAAVDRRRANASLSTVSPSNWAGYAGQVEFESSQSPSDTARVWYLVYDKAWNYSTIELAVAGTCAGQRDFLHLGGSNRQKLPHGNVAPLDGFVCEVRTDTVSFPVGQ